MNILPKEFILNGDLWTAFAGLSLVGIAGMMTIAAMRKHRLSRRLAALCFAGVVAGVAGTVLCGPHPNDVRVQNTGTRLLLSPFEGAEVKTVLKPGEKVRAKKSHGDYAYVKTPNGAAGWVEKGEVSRFVGNW